MNKNGTNNVLGELIFYFVIVFVGEFILAKIFAPVEAIPVFLADGNYFKMLLLMFLAYALYLFAAMSTIEGSSDDSGKVAVAVIFIFSVYNMYNDISDSTESTIRYMFFAIPETLRIIATFQAMRI